jgi:hypothetical protein
MRYVEEMWFYSCVAKVNKCLGDFCDQTFPGKHGTYFKGVTAILSNKNSPFSRQPVKEIIQVADSPLSNSHHGGPLMASLINSCETLAFDPC